MAANRRPARLLIVAEGRTAAAICLTDAAMQAARRRGDIDVVAVCDAGRSRALRLQPARELLAGLVKRLFDRGQAVVSYRPFLRTLPGLCRRGRIPLLTPPGRDLNAPEFIQRLRSDVRPDFALALLGVQVFSGELRSAFARAVNYHNGSLPSYRGLQATAWSLFQGEKTTGFAYHHMSERLDEGPVLVEEALPIGPGASVSQLEWEKTTRAATRMDDVLAALLEGHPGSPQQGRPGYYGRRALHEIRSVERPSELTWSELERRLRAFAPLRMTLGEECWPVTRLRPVRGGDRRHRPFAFTTSDGIVVEPDRFYYLPLPLHRCHRLATGVGC